MRRQEEVRMAEGVAHNLALFLDFENFALGLTEPRERFDISRVLRRMVEKGKVVVKKAYADWSYYSSYTAALHEAGFELIDIPRRGQSGKNSADIRLCVDAMDLAYSKEHIDTFVILSGDSDFTPLVSKLKELGKHVIGVGMANATSDLLADNCDEFIYYENLEHIVSSFQVDSRVPENKREAFQLLMEALTALRRENKEVLWSSMIKETMNRLKPSFNETYHGYRSFTELLEDAERYGLLELEKEGRSGAYVVTRFGEEMRREAVPGERVRRRASVHRGRVSRLATSRHEECAHPVARASSEVAVSVGSGEGPTGAQWSVTAENTGAEASAEVAAELTGESAVATGESVSATRPVPSGPPRIVFTIGEAARRPEPRSEPGPSPSSAGESWQPPASSPETAEPTFSTAGAASAEPVVPTPVPSASSTPGATASAQEVASSTASASPAPAASPSAPSARTTPATHTRRETRPFGFGVFDTPDSPKG